MTFSSQMGLWPSGFPCVCSFSSFRAHSLRHDYSVPSHCLRCCDWRLQLPRRKQLTRWILKRPGSCIYLSSIKKVQGKKIHRNCETQVDIWPREMLFRVLAGSLDLWKVPSFLLGGSINSEIQAGCCVGWIPIYCLKEHSGTWLWDSLSLREFFSPLTPTFSFPVVK